MRLAGKVALVTGGKTSTKNPISHSGDVVGSLIEQIALIHPLKYLKEGTKITWEGKNLKAFDAYKFEW